MNRNFFETTFSNQTIGQLFLLNCRNNGGRRFIYTADSQSLSYLQSSIQIAKIVIQLKSMSLKSGDHVLCYCETPLVFLHYYLAFQFCGIIFAPLSPIFSVKYAKNLCIQMNAKFVFCEEKWVEYFQDGNVVPVMIRAPDFKKETDFERKCSDAYDLLESTHFQVSAKNPIILQPTSGSTGAPKLVFRSHIALTHYACQLADHLFEENFTHRYLMLLSMAHSFAYHQTTTALMLGAELAISERIDTDVTAQEIFRLNPTIAVMPPRVLRSLFSLNGKLGRPILAHPESKIAPSLKYVVIGGGKANQEQLDVFHRQGVLPIEIYSTSETSMVAISPKGKWAPNIKLEPLPNVQICVQNDGEISLKSPAMMLGYYNDTLATKSAYDNNGFYLTGDLGTLSTDNKLVYLGRKKDLFNTPEGSNIYPVQIEQMIEAIPDVKQAILLADGTPFLSALIVTDLLVDSSFNTEKYLNPDSFTVLYKNWGELLSKLNEKLERHEKVIRFFIMSQEFDPTCYSIVNGAKVKRDRSNILKVYEEEYNMLYDSDSSFVVNWVPNVERRMRRKNKATVDQLKDIKKAG